MSVIADIPVPAADGNGAGVDVSTMGPDKTVTVSGEFTGLIFLEASTDGGTSYAPLGLIRPVSGGQPTVLKVSVVCNRLRARKAGTTAVAAAPNLDVAAEAATNLFATLETPVGGGVGALTDVATFGPAKTFSVAGDFDGAIIIEESADDTTWNAVVRFAPGQAVQNFIGVFKSVRVTWTGSVGTPVITVGGSTSGGGSAAVITGTEAEPSPAVFGDSTSGLYPTGNGVGISVATKKVVTFERQGLNVVAEIGGGNATDENISIKLRDGAGNQGEVRLGSGKNLVVNCPNITLLSEYEVSELERKIVLDAQNIVLKGAGNVPRIYKYVDTIDCFAAAATEATLINAKSPNWIWRFLQIDFILLDRQGVLSALPTWKIGNNPAHDNMGTVTIAQSLAEVNAASGPNVMGQLTITRPPFSEVTDLETDAILEMVTPAEGDPGAVLTIRPISYGYFAEKDGFFP